MMSSYEPTRFQIRRLRMYEAGCFLVLLAAAVLMCLLYVLGSSNSWEPVPELGQAGVLPEADRVLLAGDGDWLVWVDSTRKVLGAYDLSHPGRTVFLRPPPNSGVRPFEVLDGELIALVSVPKASLWDVFRRGWESLIQTAEPLRNPALEPDSNFVPSSLTVHLQRVNLETGRVVTALSGNSHVLDAQDRPPTDLEGGNVSLSPNRLNLAWWSAQEKVGESPLSATVTETLEILSSGSKFKRLLDKEIKTDGTLSVRSRLLERVGWPVWMDNDRCLIFSTLDSGSLIPFDCGEGTIEATVPLPALQQTLTEGGPVSNYDPEGFQILHGKDGRNSEVLVWSRLPGSLHLFVLDPLFHLIRHAQIEDKDLDLSQTHWLERSQVLLVEDRSSSHLVGFTAQGEREGVYPIPPDWGESFRILGENREGDLIGYNRGSFLSAKSGDVAWETMDLIR